MEIYESEEQQVEAIKAWWKKNGKSVIAGAAIGLGLIFGWRAYNEQQLSAQEQASAAYANVIELQQKNDPAADAAFEQFIDENSGNEYAAMAALSLAKKFAGNKQFPEAEEQLLWVVNHGDELFASLAALRLARVQTELQKYDDALANLAKITAEAYQAAVAEAKGDIYISQANVDAAREAYQDAVTLSGMPVDRNLQMKLDDLTEADTAVTSVSLAESSSNAAESVQ